MMLKKLFLLVCLSLTFQLSHATDLIGLYENSVSRKPYVEFLARGGVPGHAYVAIGEELDNGLIFQKGVFGFYPDSDGKLSSIKLLFSVDGVIDFKIPDINHDLSYRVSIYEDQLKAAEGVLKKWQGSDYSLFGNNCSKMAAEVAKAIGLKLPKGKSPGSNLPINYMKALKRANN